LIFIIVFKLSHELRYEKHIESARKKAVRKGAVNSVLTGFIYIILFCSYALAFWYGNRLIRNEKYAIGKVVLVSASTYLNI